ncbi:MAG: tripartite tricarboxylate transporter substrate binding protein [Alphaproteobacteria bacterium]|nr:tripartite tricarboxylate transporter substrate binding protein [Alphaproteobacteria bacterium]
MLLSRFGPVLADDYPGRPIQIVVPYAPSGGTDFVARELGNGLSAKFGQQVVVANRPGAATIVGTEVVAKARPDGYTLLMTSFPLAANPSLYAKLPYDAAADLSPVSLITNAPTFLVINPKLPVADAKSLVAYCRERPGEVSYASYGTGSGAHLAAALFETMTGTKLLHVPYEGGAPAARAVMSGETQLLFSSALPVLGNIKAEQLRVLAVAAPARLAALPDVPTFREAGIDYVTGTWFGLLAPARTPTPIIDKLYEGVAASLASPSLRAQLSAQGADVVGSTPQDFAEFLHNETERWADVIARAGITKQ